MPTIFIDTEHEHDSKRSLKKMSLLQYLKVAPIIGAAYGVDDSELEWIPKTSPSFMEWIGWLHEVAGDPSWTFVAYNTSFDWRSLRYGVVETDTQPLGVPHPCVSHDALAMSRAAWPGQPICLEGERSYSLANIARWLRLPPKLKMEDAKKGKVSWEEYCCRDVLLCREIYRRALPRMSADELRIMEMCERLKGLCLEIDHGKVAEAQEALGKLSSDALVEMVQLIGDDGQNLFGMDGEEVKSVKPQKVKDALAKHFGFITGTISEKKIAPSELSANQQAGACIKIAGSANRAMSHRRKVKVLGTMSEMPLELHYFGAANTGRSAAPCVGKGFNLLNLPKRNPVVGKAMRSLIKLPEGWCWVRADAAAVEYRTEGFLTDCRYLTEMFGKDIDAEAYGSFLRLAFGYEMKGKKDPLRQDLAKVVCLGGGFGAGNAKIMSVMAAAQASSLQNKDPSKHLTDEMLQSLADSKNMTPPKGKFYKKAIADAGCSELVGLVAYHARRMFHELHWEFFTVSRWLMDTVEGVSNAVDPEGFLDMAYRFPAAPKREKIDLRFVPELEHPTIQVRLMGWSMPTVTWRQIGTHKGCDGLAMLVPNKGARNVSPSILIENVCQSAARCMLNRARLNLEAMGWPLVMDVYDEILVACPAEPEAIKQCRADLLKAGGDYGWVFYLDPRDVTVSRSFYEDGAHSAKLFDALDKGLPCEELIATLP
jgi:hypothetical protein